MWVTSVTHCRTKITTKNGAKNTATRKAYMRQTGISSRSATPPVVTADGYSYSVDAGVIGIMPMELCEKNDTETLNQLGRYVKAKRAEFKAEDGMFHIRFDTGETIDIDTQECIDEGYDEFDIKEDW